MDEIAEIYQSMVLDRVLNEKMIEDDRGWLTKNLDALKQKKASMPDTADHSRIDKHIANHEKAIASIDE